MNIERLIDDVLEDNEYFSSRAPDKSFARALGIERIAAVMPHLADCSAWSKSEILAMMIADILRLELAEETGQRALLNTVQNWMHKNGLWVS